MKACWGGKKRNGDTMIGQGQRTSKRQEVKNAACTWLASEVTPNLTRERDTLDAVEEIEDTLS